MSPDHCKQQTGRLHVFECRPLAGNQLEHEERGGFLARKQVNPWAQASRKHDIMARNECKPRRIQHTLWREKNCKSWRTPYTLWRESIARNFFSGGKRLQTLTYMYWSIGRCLGRRVWTNSRTPLALGSLCLGVTVFFGLNVSSCHSNQLG